MDVIYDIFPKIPQQYFSTVILLLIVTLIGGIIIGHELNK